VTLCVSNGGFLSKSETGLLVCLDSKRDHGN
jgi:hypothetical protein